MNEDTQRDKWRGVRMDEELNGRMSACIFDKEMQAQFINFGKL